MTGETEVPVSGMAVTPCLLLYHPLELGFPFVSPLSPLYTLENCRRGNELKTRLSVSRGKPQAHLRRHTAPRSRAVCRQARGRLAYLVDRRFQLGCPAPPEKSWLNSLQSALVALAIGASKSSPARSSRVARSQCQWRRDFRPVRRRKTRPRQAIAGKVCDQRFSRLCGRMSPQLGGGSAASSAVARVRVAWFSTAPAARARRPFECVRR